jgi:hypothetical protein
MKVRELITILKAFEEDADVHLCVSMPGRVAEIYEQVWVGDYGMGPQIHAALDLRGSSVYVGLIVDRPVQLPRQRAAIDLGQYATPEEAARVRDFYIFHKSLDEPLADPAFNYERWIPPRTTSGEYNEHIAKILRDKLLEE